jgi:hypothetical protein
MPNLLAALTAAVLSLLGFCPATSTGGDTACNAALSPR